MKPKTMILMVVAVVCGLAAMYMTNRLLASKDSSTAPVATVKVLVSKQKINAWQPIKTPQDLFEVKEVPEGTYSPKCITDFKDLKDQALKQPLNEQMPVTRDDLLNEQTAGVIGSLKDGQRATAIRVTPESLAGGFVLPGTKVDVMFIMKRGDGDSHSQIILQDMLVLAVDQKNTREDGQTSILGSTATLATTAEEAEELALASSLGELRLLLRSPLDRGNVRYKPVTMVDLARQQRPKDGDTTASPDDPTTNSGASAVLPTLPTVDKKPEPKPEPVAEKPDPAKTHTLRIESGDTVNRTIFVWDKEHNCWEGGEAKRKADAPKPEDAPKPDAPKSDAPKPAPAPAPVG